MRRRVVGVEIAGPLRLGGLECRRCGGRSIVWYLVGVPKGIPPWYFECEECGVGEVATGNPMRFGVMPGVPREVLEERWNQYRKGAGLVLYGQFEEKKLSSDKYVAGG